MKETCMRVTLIGLSPAAYSSHSYRSGCATTATMAGLSDWEIKLLGHWASDAYQRYIRALVPLLRLFATKLSWPVSGTPFSFWNAYVANVI